MGRLRLLTVERLTARFAVGITVLVMVPIGTGLYLLSRYEYGHSIATRRAAGEFENQILEAARRHQMIRRDSRLMTEVLREVASR